MNPLVIGRPLGGGLTATENLVEELGFPVTLAWNQRDELEEVIPALLKAGGSALFVDSAKPELGRAAYAHQLEVMGVPHFVLIVVHFEQDLQQALPLILLALEFFPPTAVLIEGSNSTFKTISQIVTDMDLQVPLSVNSEDRVITAKSLARSARWENA